MIIGGVFDIEEGPQTGETLKWLGDDGIQFEERKPGALRQHERDDRGSFRGPIGLFSNPIRFMFYAAVLGAPTLIFQVVNGAINRLWMKKTLSHVGEGMADEEEGNTEEDLLRSLVEAMAMTTLCRSSTRQDSPRRQKETSWLNN